MPELPRLRAGVAEPESFVPIWRPGRDALRESELRYRRLFEAARDGILILDAETGVIDAANPFLMELLGYSEGQLLGKTLWEIGPFKDKRLSKAAFGELQTRKYIRYEDLPLETKDGRAVAVEFVSNVYTVDNKKVIQCNIRDITERKQAQAVEARLVAILEATPDLVSISHADGQLVYLNHAGRAMLGLVEPVDLSVLNIRDFYDAANAQLILTEAIPTAVREGHWMGETEGRALDGHLIAVSQVVLAHMAPDGRLAFLSTIARDITERRRTDESVRLQGAALQAAADAIVITDRTGVIEWVNAAFTQMTGYASDEAVGTALLRSGSEAPAWAAECWSALRSGGTWRGEGISHRKNGSLFTLRQAVTPILDAAGTASNFVAIQQDITERLLLEAQVRQTQKMESVGQLTSGIAHDFNNLLAVINGMSYLVMTQLRPDDPARADVREIQQAGDRAADLTRQLLAFSRQQILELRVLRVSTVVSGMEGLLRRLLGEDVNLVIIPTPNGDRVMADAGQIEQVVTNLAVNARDAMPHGGHLTIEVQSVTIDETSPNLFGEVVPPGRYVRLTVGDSGAGMDEAIRSRMFEPFFTTKEPGKGTGLGLSTVYGIVKQSNGFIRVYSEIGQGTSFAIYLPQVAAVVDIAPPAPVVASATRGETVLVVEDNDGLRALIARFLEPAGYTVVGASTGEEALALLAGRERPVHLMLTDVVLPGISGRRLAEQLAVAHPDLKVVYMSGYTSDTIIRHGVLEAKVPFLNKPFTAAALRQKVSETLDADAAPSH